MIPMDAPFIDLHTHHTRIDSGLYSYGIHPWHVETDRDTGLLEHLLEEGRLAAIGETGIDRIHKDTLSLQLDVFEKHIQLSEYYQKPLIIHNVKATADLMRFHKKYQPRQTWIIHGFNGSVEEMAQLVGCSCCLSVGESIFYTNRKISKSILSIPLDYLFLETDTSEKTIQQIYEKAAELLNLSVDQLRKQLFSNFVRLNLKGWKTGNNVTDCSSAPIALRNLEKEQIGIS